MTQSISKIKIKSKPKKSASEEFARLWRQVLAERENLLQLPAQVAEFYQFFEGQVGRVEREYAKALCLEIEWLWRCWEEYPLVQRERLAVYDRVRFNWQQLQQSSFTEVVDMGCLGNIVRQMSKEIPTSACIPDDISQQTAIESTDENSASRAKQLFDQSSVTRMFRQLSRMFHPDLAQEEQEKMQRHELMSKLLHARDVRDIATVFELYSQYVGDVILDDRDYIALNELLKLRLQQLRHEREDIIMAAPAAGWIYLRFYKKQKNVQAIGIAQYSRDLQAATSTIGTRLRGGHSLSHLRGILQEWGS